MFYFCITLFLFHLKKWFWLVPSVFSFSFILLQCFARHRLETKMKTKNFYINSTSSRSYLYCAAIWFCFGLSYLEWIYYYSLLLFASVCTISQTQFVLCAILFLHLFILSYWIIIRFFFVTHLLWIFSFLEQIFFFLPLYISMKCIVLPVYRSRIVTNYTSLSMCISSLFIFIWQYSDSHTLTLF